jgi:hypothetical protein
VSKSSLFSVGSIRKKTENLQVQPSPEETNTELNIPPVECADEWQIFLWNLPDDLLTRPQKLEMMLMLETRFDAFNPFRVVADLLRHRDLWTGAVVERGYVFSEPKRPNWTDAIFATVRGR